RRAANPARWQKAMVGRCKDVSCKPCGTRPQARHECVLRARRSRSASLRHVRCTVNNGNSATRSEEAMHILWMLIIGLVAGALAKLIMPGKDPGGLVVTLLLGLAG